ncbi:nuclear transport factor 2 family protein [Pseudonocardia spinosispora]|uniref:nuclear transport factor 2 family protein n=1 Tax=Pseudonocardia spinosispora TaxID=103441 RepID=UPI00041A41E6|nr:nuclear transport factor 2 family protein [Pseudonocardia spinosispora]
MSVENLEDFRALDPFFRTIEQGLKGRVDGDHFFDFLAEDVVFEYVVTVPDYPRTVTGKANLVELYRGYGDTFSLDFCGELRGYFDPDASVAVLEYASRGRAVRTGTSYANNYISVITISDRKITHWRDYLNPLAVLTALAPDS